MVAARLAAASGTRIEFDEHRIALDLPGTAHEIAGFSSAGRVPILILDDVTIWDTLAIAETVAERWPDKKLWPVDPTARAHARAISAEMHSGFETLRNCMPMNCRAMGRKIAIPDELGADIDRIIAIWVTAIASTESRVAGCSVIFQSRMQCLLRWS